MALCGPVTNPILVPVDPAAQMRMLISTYFPQQQWEHAWCIVQLECSPDRPGYPGSCVREEGQLKCNAESQAVAARAWGPFQLLDACWDPSINPASPFTPEQWARVLDPNYNTWMAARVWSSMGWSAWTTYERCNLRRDTGGAVPYPDAPLDNLSLYPPQQNCGQGFHTWPLLIGLGMVTGGILLSIASGERK